MAEKPDTPNTPEKPKLSLSAAEVATLSAAAGALHEVNSVLGNIARNPLIAGVVLVNAQQRLGEYINKWRELKKEIDQNTTGFNKITSLLRDPKLAVASGTILSIGLRFRALTEEINKTAVALYKVTGNIGAGQQGFAQNLIKTQANLLSQYGREFSDQYARTVQTLQRRISKEGVSSELLKTITGLTIATGTDYAKAVEDLQDSFSMYGLTVDRAVGYTEAIRESWRKGDTAIGNLNDNIELGISLMKKYKEMGLDVGQSAKAALQMLQVAGQLNLTVGETQRLSSNLQQIGRFGQEGMQARLRLRAGIQHVGMNAQQTKMLEEAGLSKMPIDEAMFVLQNESPGKFASFMQQHARQALGVKEGEEINFRKLAPKRTQIQKEFGFGGFGFEDIVELAKGKTIDVTKLKTSQEQEQLLAGKIHDVSTKTFEEFDKGLSDLVADARKWSEWIEGSFKNITNVSYGLFGQFTNLLVAVGSLGVAISTVSRILTMMKMPIPTPPTTVPPPTGYGGGYTSTLGGYTYTYGGGGTPPPPAGGGTPAPVPPPGGGGIIARGGGRFMRGAGNAFNRIYGNPMVTMGGFAANAIAAQFLEQPQSAVESGLTTAAGFVPFGTVAAVAGQQAGKHLVAPLLQKIFGKSGEDVVAGGIGGEEDPAIAELKKMAMAGNKDASLELQKTIARNEQMKSKNAIFIEKYNKQYGGGTGGSRDANAPSINNQINVYLDSEKIAARVEEKQNFLATTKPNK
jgi:hypothetical protein